MGEEGFTIKTVDTTRVNGVITKWTGMESYTTRVVSWLTKVNGLKTSSTVWVRCTMTIQSHLLAVLTLLTSIIFKIIGSITREC